MYVGTLGEDGVMGAVAEGVLIAVVGTSPPHLPFLCPPAEKVSRVRTCWEKSREAGELLGVLRPPNPSLSCQGTSAGACSGREEQMDPHRSQGSCQPGAAGARQLLTT